MFHSILVPLDGSPFGEHALPLALTISRRSGCPIRVIHVHAPEDPKHPDWYMPAERRANPTAVAMQDAYLAEIVDKLKAAGVSASSALVEGSTVSALCEHVTSSGADLVALTTHGRGPLSRFWLGSVADALVRQLRVSVLLVRPTDKPVDFSSEARCRHILIPLDGSKHAEKIMAPALELGKVMDATVTLFQVVAPVPMLGYDVFGYAPAGTDVVLVEKLREQSVGYLEEVATRLRNQGLKVRPVVAVNPSAASAILHEAEARAYDLIALETHGRGGASRLLLGSVADKVVRGATAPVLVHRSPET